MNKQEIDAIESIDAFEESICAFSDIDVSDRGGKIGCHGSDIADFLGVDENQLPPKLGVYCNYLGGGVRGALIRSGYSPAISGEKKVLLDALLSAIERIYLSCEAPANEEHLDDGEVDWNAVATYAARNAGIKSAY